MDVGESARKPYKVSGRNREFKGIVASDLAELKSAACRSLQFPSTEDVKVLMEDDLTEVDNEEYFQFLPPQTKFLIQRRGEKLDFGE